MNCLKQLSLIVPAYNSQKYLHKCLNSLLDVNLSHLYEVIIVDDGSTDDTKKIAEDFSEKYPEIFSLISKKNGGHGSTINCAIPYISGKYFKVIDSDDWVINLGTFLNEISKTDVDVIITGYQSINMTTSKILDFPVDCKFSNREITISNLLEVYESVSSSCSFHGVTYKTELYKNSKITLTEGVFYEDQEFASFPFLYAKTIKILPIFFYQYLVGNPDQSVAFHNQVARISHIEKICYSMANYMSSRNSNPENQEFFTRKLAVVVVSYFATALVKNPNKAEGRVLAKKFHSWLAVKSPEVKKRINKKLFLLVVMNYLYVSPKLYQSILDTDIYKQVRKIWTN